jgi:2'-5' RNA ligase
MCFVFCLQFEENECSNDEADEQIYDLSKPEIHKKRPNFFVALQITDTNTIEKLLDVQNQVIKWYPSYTDHKIPANGFHLTLSVLKLENTSDNQACFDAMNQAKSKLEKLARNTEPLILQDLDHFNRRVIYAKVKYSQQFLALVDEIRDIFINAGFDVGSSSFKPHLTLFNVRRSVCLERKDILLNAFNDSDCPFGSQAIDNIQVCRMGTLPKGDSTEFYENIFRFDM